MAFDGGGDVTQMIPRRRGRFEAFLGCEFAHALCERIDHDRRVLAEGRQVEFGFGDSIGHLLDGVDKGSSDAAARQRPGDDPVVGFGGGGDDEARLAAPGG